MRYYKTTGCSAANRIGLLACMLIVGSCAPQERDNLELTDQSGPPDVYTVNYPLAYFAERIAEDAVNVVLPAPADVDPAVWSPAAETVENYQQADLVLLNGAGYAGWIQRVSLSQSRLIDTSAALQDRLIPVADEVTHRHGPSGDHSHQGTAFTTWLDVELAIGQAHAVFDALVRLQPEGETAFRERLMGLEQDLLKLDKGLQDVAARIGDRPLLFSHPVYQYLLRRYDLNGYSLHWEPQELPDEAAWRELSRLLEEHPAAWMIWEDEPHQETVSRLERMGIASLVFRPCGNRPADGDFLHAMQGNLKALEQAFPVSTSHVGDIE